MAQRKAPQTEPILDNSALAADPNLEVSKVVKSLPSNQFSSIIRCIRVLDPEKTTAIRLAVERRLKEFGIESDLNLAYGRTPRTGSLQFDAGSFISWADKITVNDDDAIRQLVIIDATIRTRKK